MGLFELAKDGTLFLDEIGDLPFSVQAELLRCLDDHEIMPLGVAKPRVVDCTSRCAVDSVLAQPRGKRQGKNHCAAAVNLSFRGNAVSRVIINPARAIGRCPKATA